MGEPKPGCDCEELRNGDFHPLCQNPADNSYGKNQYFAKAYPGLRELQVLKDFGRNAVVASICARNLNDDRAQDYGYRPAMDAIADRMSRALVARCLPRKVAVDAVSKKLPCEVIEARPAGASCDDTRGRAPASNAAAVAVREKMAQLGACDGVALPECESLTLCAVREAGPACHRDVPQPEAGWCLIDPSQNPDDDPALAGRCSSDEGGFIRFVDPENRPPESGGALLLFCGGS